MNLASLLADEPARCAAFPVAGQTVYLAHAGVCPLPRAVEEAVSNYARTGTTGDQEEGVPRSFIDQTRKAAARRLGAQPSEVAFVGPTSLALSFVAAGLPWRPGDNLIAYRDDYPSNVYPWMALASRGVEVRWIQADALGRIEPDHVLAQVDRRTRLVALASCHFIAGWRLDYETIGHCLRQRGVWFCLDAIQTLGAFPINAASVDFLAADAHKWLLGPCAAGLLYVRQEIQTHLAPQAFGWHNVDCPHFVSQDTLALRSDARRYEAGSANLLGLVGLRAALDLLDHFGTEAIAAELLRKRARLIPQIQACGYHVLHATAPSANASAIMSLFRPGQDMTALHQRFRQHGIATSLRTDRTGQNYVRLSPHFYNTDAELDQALACLR